MKMIFTVLPIWFAVSTHAFGNPEWTVELHAHLFMKEGMTWLFRGHFDEPLRATSWKDRLSSQTNAEALEKSGIGVLVVSIYAHPWLVWSVRDSIRRQLDQIELFAFQHSNWKIARSSQEAREIIRSGNHVIVLALEGAHGALQSETDFAEFIDRRGIRIVTLLHLTDDPFGGAALMSGLKKLCNPWVWFKQIFYSHQEEGVATNPLGLTSEGLALAQELIRRGVWIDLAHSSDAAQKTLLPLLQKERQPLLYTHTVLRKYAGNERAISPAQLEEIRKSEGIVGLMPSEEMLEGTPVADPQCQGSIQSLAVQYREMSAALGSSDSVVFGTDFNGGISHLKPGCAPGTELDTQGFWNIGQVPEVWRALAQTGAPVPSPRNRMIEKFLQAWEKAQSDTARSH